MWLPPLCPSLPAPPCLPSSPACQGAQEGQCTPSPLCWGYASPAPQFTCPHALFVRMLVSARGTACPSQSPLARLCHTPTPQFMHPTLPTCLPPLHACQGHRRDEGDACKGRVTHKGRVRDQEGCVQGEGLHTRGGGGTRGGVHKGKGCTQGKGEDQGGCTQGEGPDARGGGGCGSKRAGLHTNRRGACTLSAPPVPSRLTWKNSMYCISYSSFHIYVESLFFWGVP